MSLGNTVKIRPKVAMFGAFSRLNYKPWFALAEFVDNSLQSFLSNRDRLRETSPGTDQLVVTVTIEDNRIVVHDNAAGIRIDEFARAFVPAQRPMDTSGLSEFGLGMKAAACWFAKHWSVRTCALGEGVERTIYFNVAEIVANETEDLTFTPREVDKTWHYTVLVLWELNQRMRGAGIARVKSHLAGIYREYISNGVLKLVVNDEELQFTPPKILMAPYCKTPDAEAVEWKKADLRVDVDASHRVTGWAALRAKGSVAEAGFAVFRRGRVILGSGESPYRPEKIFKKSNSYTYQRLFGELHVEGFDVSHTKDGLQWNEWEELILEDLRKQLEAEPLRLLTQAEDYRARAATRTDEDNTFGDQAAARTAEALQQHAGPIVGAQIGAGPEPDTPPPVHLPPAKVTTRREVTLNLEHEGRRWRMVIELAPDPGVEDWYSFSRQETEDSVSEVTVRVSMAHPFTERFGLKDVEEMEPLVRIAAGLALAEVAALDVGISKRIKTLRRNFNQLLRQALSR